jgi:multidrug transporter EmrE-like cation transporter
VGELEFGLRQAHGTIAGRDQKQFLEQWQKETHAIAFIEPAIWRIVRGRHAGTHRRARREQHRSGAPVRLADFGWLMTGVALNAVLAQLGLKNATATTGFIEGTRQGLWTAAQQLSVSVSFWLALLATGFRWWWIVGLSRLPVSQAYPVLSVGYVITALLAWMLFGETLSLERWAGIGLIILGVVLVSSSH